MTRTLRSSTALLLALGAGSVLLGLSACETSLDASLAGPSYPEERAQARTIPVQVEVEGPAIRYINTTAEAFGPYRLWLNRWYSRDMPGLEPGQSVRVELKTLRDEYGGAYPGGGFFAADDPERLVQAQIELLGGANAGQMIGLIVIPPFAD